MEDLQAFQLEEYRSLRKEIEIYITEFRTQEHYSVIAAAVTWAWLLVQGTTSGYLWAVPALPTALIAFRAYAMQRHFRDMKGYIYLLEDSFCAEKSGTAPCGWEHQTLRPNVGVANIALTLALLVVAIAAWFLRYKLVSGIVHASR